MQRFCAKLRSVSVQSNRNIFSIGAPHRLIHHSPSPSSQFTLGFATSKWSVVTAAALGGVSPLNASSIGSTFVPHHFVQVRNITSKEKMAKWKKKWRPRTPITSKVKKVKIKFYSSYKDRFKPLHDGTIRRWKEGKPQRTLEVKEIEAQIETAWTSTTSICQSHEETQFLRLRDRERNSMIMNL